MTHLDLSQTLTQTPRQARAERILDVAGELMLRFGYKRVTVDDVALRADIGKGTIYQHWKTREMLFSAVFLREFAAAIDELQTAIRQEPRTALLHSLMATMYLTIMRRPLMRAVYTVDLDTMGKLAKSDFSRVIDIQDNPVFNAYLQLLVGQGLVRADLTPDELFYTFIDIVTGFFTYETFNTQPLQIDTERKADLIASAIQRTFEIDSSPSAEVIQEVAQETLGLLTRLSEIYRSMLRPAYE
jgi:AcrR family transcriptional regulator